MGVSLGIKHSCGLGAIFQTLLYFGAKRCAPPSPLGLETMGFRRVGGHKNEGHCQKEKYTSHERNGADNSNIIGKPHYVELFAKHDRGSMRHC